MAAANHDDRVVRRRPVQVVPQGQTLLRQLAFVPVAVGDDQIAAGRGGGALGDGAKQVGDGAGAGEVHAGAAPKSVEVVVGEGGDDGAPLQVDHRRFRAQQPQHLGVGAGCQDGASGDRQRLHRAQLGVQRAYPTVVQDQLRRRGRHAARGEGDQGRERSRGKSG